jgi:hypothetical protein
MKFLDESRKNKTSLIVELIEFKNIIGVNKKSMILSLNKYDAIIKSKYRESESIANGYTGNK